MIYYVLFSLFKGFVDMDLHSLDAYQYDLPQELIAQSPAETRDASRLMIIERKTGSIREIPFKELPSLVKSKDSFVFNDTRVIPARLNGIRESGGKTEIFLLEECVDGTWFALARPSRKLRPHSIINFSETFRCSILEVLEEGKVRLQFNDPSNVNENLKKYGKIPLPRYIQREPDAKDTERYQTVFAQNPGAVAAPTAGLHFTNEILGQLSSKGVKQNFLTLHVGVGTFKPVLTSDIRDHRMHSERVYISEKTAAMLNSRSKEETQICVGTTCCRALEASANEEGIIMAGQQETKIFIYPGYQFKYVQTLMTNFHLPGSTLLMLVSAFAGYELTMEAYHKAVKDRFRFFSYGDAMLIF